MIYWKDFVLDDVIGPYLKVRFSDPRSREKNAQCPGVMEDAIQETGQVKRPARMVGPTSLEEVVKSGMEAGLGKKISRNHERER